jgi:nucleoid DNA-binding protein
METQTQYQSTTPISSITDYEYFFPKKNKSFRKLITDTASKSKLSTSQVSRIISCFLSQIEYNLINNEKVSIYGIGVLNLKKNKQRILNAPNNMGQIKPAFWSVGFKYDKDLSQRLNQNAALIKKLEEKIKKKK